MCGKEYEQNTFPWYAPEYRGPVNRNQLVPDYLSLTPREIKAELEKSVIGQEEACRQMAIMKRWIREVRPCLVLRLLFVKTLSGRL